MTYGQSSHNYDRLEEVEEGTTHRPKEGHSSRYRHLVSVRFRDLLAFALVIPLLSFLFNIFYVLITDFEAATSSVCTSQMRKVPNYLPSFSAVIGLFQFNEVVWNVTVALTGAPRLLFTAMTFAHLRQVVSSEKQVTVRVIAGLSLLESLSLTLITFVSSTVNFPVHMWSFIMFVFSSAAHMFLTCYVLEYHRHNSASSRERRGLQLKWRLVTVNVAATLLSFYAYYRHENYCEVGVYTAFAFLEYLVIVSNIGFHGTLYFDFYDRKLII